MKQTSTDWVISELEKFERGESEYFSKVAIKNRARRMCKEQLVKAHKLGMINCMVGSGIQECDFESESERYYHKTFGSGNDN